MRPGARVSRISPRLSLQPPRILRGLLWAGTPGRQLCCRLCLHGFELGVEVLGARRLVEPERVSAEPALPEEPRGRQTREAPRLGNVSRVQCEKPPASASRHEAPPSRSRG